MRAVFRRSFLVAALFGAVGILAGGESAKAEPDPMVAAAHIEKLTGAAITILERDDLELTDREKMFAVLLRDGFDVDLIGRFVIGRYRSRATPDELDLYDWLFQDYVIKVYTQRLSNFAGEQVTITGTRIIDDRDVFVNTRIARPGGTPIDTAWRIRMNGGAPKIIDVMVEGLSMVVTQRDEFASVLRRQGISGLLQLLESKTLELTTAGQS